MDESLAWQTIADERVAFADVLDTLSPEQWAAPSLCGAWTVREVVAHTMVGQTGSLAGFAKAMLAARGRFDVANQRLAAARATLPTSVLADDLRTRAGHRFTPPGFDWHAPLTDLFIHRLDCLQPLDIATDRPLDAWPEILDLLVSRKARKVFVPPGLPDLTLVATDCPWSSGSGPRVEGPVEALALTLTGRPVRLDELVGPGSDVLRAWSGG